MTGSKTEELITWEMAADLYRYNVDTGDITFLRGFKAGKLAEDKSGDGYRRVRINGRNFYAHRVAWLLANREWPDGVIDHRDGNRSNNALSNLRVATTQLNMANSKVGARNKTGFKGVSKRNGKFHAIIHKDRKQLRLGSYQTEHEAAAAYKEAAVRLFGKFARTTP